MILIRPIVVLVFLLRLNFLFAQQDSLVLVKDNVNCVYGYKNAKQTKWVLEPVYSSATEFYHGFAIVSKDLKFGVINPKGKFVIPLRYKSIRFWLNNRNHDLNYGYNGDDEYEYSEEDVVNGTFVFTAENNKQGLINSSGVIMINAQYSSIYDLHMDLAEVRNEDDLKGFINEDGEQIVPVKYESLDWTGQDGMHQFYEDGLAGLATKDGIVLKPEYSDIEYSGYSTFIVAKGSYYGIVGVNNVVLAPIEYDKLEFLSPAWMIFYKGKKQGLLNRDTGKEKADLNLSGIRKIGYNFILGKRNNKYGILNDQLEVQVPFMNDTFFVSYSNVYMVQNGIAEYYNGEMKKIDLQESDEKKVYGDKIIINTNNGYSYGMMDTTGKILLWPKYRCRIHPDFILFADEKEKTKFYYSKEGKLIPYFDKYNAVYGATKEFNVVVSRNKKIGIVNNHGKLLVDTAYTVLHALESDYGLFWAAKEEWKEMESLCVKYGLVDTSNHVVLSFDMDVPGYVTEKAIAVFKDGKWKFIDHKGKLINENEFDELAPENETDLFRVTKGGLIGFTDQDGKVIFEPRFSTVSGFINGVALVEEDGEELKKGMVDAAGDFVVELKPEGLIYADKPLLHTYFELFTPPFGGWIRKENYWIQRVNFQNIGYDQIYNFPDTSMINVYSNFIWTKAYEILEEDRNYDVNNGVSSCLYNAITYTEKGQWFNQYDTYFSQYSNKKIEFLSLYKNCLSVCTTKTYYDRYGSSTEIRFESWFFSETTLQQLTIETIFDESKNYLRELNTLLYKKIQFTSGPELNCSDPNSFIQIAKESFSVDKNGITFYFVSSDEEGYQSVLLAPKEFRHLLKADSVLSGYFD